LILDHAGNHLRLGTVTDIGQDHLDDGSERQSTGLRARERSELLPKLCEVCRAVVPRTARACPCCGAPIQARTAVENVDGELVQLGSRRTGSAAPSISEKFSFYGELCWIARDRSYASGWASHKYRERFGDPRVRCAPPTPPSIKTRNWIVSRRIALAKAKERVAHG
jgi:hypothetical protein